MTLFTAIVTAHKQEKELRNMMIQLKSQQFEGMEVLVYYSDMEIKGIPTYDMNVSFIKCPNKNDWGHEKRAMGLKKASGEFLCFFNADDEYLPQFVNTMLANAIHQQKQFVYCDFRSRHFGGNICKAALQCGRITSGCYIVETELAQKAGYNSRRYEADWDFIEGVLKENPETLHVPMVLYQHN